MTPNEANILGYLEKLGKHTTTHRLAHQFRMDLAAIELVLRSMASHLLVEQDGQHVRSRLEAAEALADFRQGYTYTPFDKERGW